MMKQIKGKRVMGLLFMLTVLIAFTSFLNHIDNFTKENEDTPIFEDIQNVNFANIGEDVWWNISYQWRQCINITNSGDYNLTDNFINIQFDYGNLRDNYNMDPDLYDARIVENNIVRNYYVKKDFPTSDIATIWFETNSTVGESEYDTYMYWGNASINYRGSNHVNYDPSGTAWWSFEEGSGNQGSTVVDSLNYANATLWGTGGNYPDYVTDSAVGDYSLEFNGASDFVYINDELHFTYPNEITEFTVSCWFKTDFSSSGDYTQNWAFFDFDRSEFFNFYIDCDNDANGGLTEGRIGFSSSASGSSTNDFYGNVYGLNNDMWHFACIVYDGSDKYIYVDDYPADVFANAHGGVGIGTGLDRWGFFGDGSEATSENGARNDRYYDGKLDEIRYFEYAVAPDEIQWLANFYPIETNLLDITERAATVIVIVKDVDGRRVPEAEVSLWNYTEILTVNSTPYTFFTQPDGTVEFSKVPFSTYNITVNYTLNSGLENVVYNSSNITDGEVEFRGLEVNTTVYTNLWTIDFEVDDWDGEPLNYGYINVSKGTSEILETLSLDQDGKATFRWENRSSYNYSVFYENEDYEIENPTLLNSSIITRESTKTIYLVNETNSDPPGTQTYSVNIEHFLSGSSYGNPGSITAIDASIKLDKMDNLTQVRIWYADDTGYRFKELRDYSDLATNDTFIYHPGEEETYEVYGLRLEVDGENKTQCNGIIEINLTYAYSQYIRTNMSKLNIRVIDDSETVPVEGITVRVEINGTRELVTELKTDDNGIAYGLFNDELGFWYKTEKVYNFSLWVITEQRTFSVNESDQHFIDEQLLDYYNYTLYSTSSLTFSLDLNYENRISRFQNTSLIANMSIIWEKNMTFSLLYETSDNGVGGPWTLDDNSGTEITCTIKSTDIGNPIIFEQPMDFKGPGNTGNYTMQINSSQFSAGNYGKSYIVLISGKKLYYNSPQDVAFLLQINPKATSMSFHNYSSMPDEIITNEISQYYNEVINITVKYIDSISSNPLSPDAISYNWDYGLGAIDPDPMNPGFYTFELNTSAAIVVGKYRIDITAELENHTKIDNYGIYINILSRPTLINGTRDILFMNEKIYALISKNFTFDYTDFLSSSRISAPDIITYTWQKLDESGDPIPGATKTGSLIETLDHRYILDLNTEFLEFGDYFVFLTFDKLNYESRSVTIDFSILERPTTLNGSDPFIPSPFSINLGDTVNFTFSYIDTLTNTSITNLDTQSYNYTSTASSDPSGSGTLAYDPSNELYYFLGFNTAIKPNGTYTITVTFEKVNYSSQITQISLIINYIIEDFSSYLTLISQNPINFETDIYWRDVVTINFNFTTQYLDNDPGLAHPTYISLQFLDEILNPIGNSINLIDYNTSKGVYEYSFNTSLFSFIGDQSYFININAVKTNPPHNLPIPLVIPFTVHSVLTNFTAHNYTTNIEFPSYTITEYWNQTFGITLFYSELISGAPISNAIVTYSWFYGSGLILPDTTKGSGYYSFNFNTGDAPEIGSYTINFQAVKQNFTYGVLSSDFIIEIINRPTLLNISEDVLYLSDKLHVKDSHNFTFQFIDKLTSRFIDNADEMRFILQKLDINGGPIPGTTIIGVLHETVDHQYILDVNTASLKDGEYSIVITLNKKNYDLRVSIISLIIEKREFSWQLSTDRLIKVESGGTLILTIDLTDPYNNSVSVIGANVYMMFRGITYSFTDNLDGTYSLRLDEIPNAFFMSKTIVGTIHIEKSNYTTETIDFTLVVNMEEIFPGMPTFYFLMIVGSIIAVVGSLATYRIVQQRRIPTFIKKARKMKKEIKGKKQISESLLYPSKEEYLVKKLGDHWNTLGLSLNDVLGVEIKKKKVLPGIKEEIEELKGGEE